MYSDKQKKEEKFYGKNLFYIVGVSVIFFVISLIKAKQAEYSLNFRTLVQIGLMLMPAMYTFCFINIFSTKNIIHFMEITLGILIIIYFCEPPHQLLSFFDMSKWAKIDLLDSNSCFTESSLCAEPFLQLFLFFYYFSNIKNKNINNKVLKICKWVSLVFTILCFKRLGVVFAIAMLLIEKIVDIRGKISSRFVLAFAIFFTIATIFYTKFMQGEILTSIDTYKLSTGRDYILSLWEKRDYLSFGYGTSMLLIGRYLELDLVQIYLELNIFAVFAFSYGFFKIANKNIYSLLIMTYAFMNMLTASSLPWSLGWIILLLTVSIISSDKCSDENIEIDIKKQKFSRLFSIKTENTNQEGK